MPSTTPKRKILRTYGNPLDHRTARGIMKTATLDCGHVEDVAATERRRGCIHCFGCFYGKPVPGYSTITDQEREAFEAAHDGGPMPGRPAPVISR